MKIYDEVVVQFNEDTGVWDTIYEDSFEHNDDIMMCGGTKHGDDEIREQDDALKQSAFGQLNEMADEYKRMSEPGGYFDEKGKKLASDAQKGMQDLADKHNLASQQSQRSYGQASSSAQQSYQQTQSETKANIQNMMEKSRMEAQSARESAAQDAYTLATASSKGGLAGVGGRARAMLGKKKAAGVDAIALGLKMQKEGAERQLAQAEIGRNAATTGAAAAMRTANETSEMQMSQGRDEIARKLLDDQAELQEKQDKAASNLTSQAFALRGQTVGAFKEQYSRWDAGGHDNEPDNTGGDHAWHAKNTTKDFEDEFEKWRNE
jgi:hypothetical protein